MRFNIADYREATTERLRALQPIYRRCFAIWCLQESFEFYRADSSSNSEICFVGDAISELWKHTLADSSPSPDYLSEIKSNCVEIAKDQDDTLQCALKTELVGSLDTAADLFVGGNPRHSMLVAESVINCIDAIESERGRSPTDLLSVPEAARELRLQDEMLHWLESSPSLSFVDLRRSRSSTSNR